jgi:hypothetical protein
VSFLNACRFQYAEEMIKRFVRGEHIRPLHATRILASLEVDREDCDVVLLALSSRMT